MVLFILMPSDFVWMELRLVVVCQSDVCLVNEMVLFILVPSDLVWMEIRLVVV